MDDPQQPPPIPRSEHDPEGGAAPAPTPEPQPAQAAAAQPEARPARAEPRAEEVEATPLTESERRAPHVDAPRPVAGTQAGGPSTGDASGTSAGDAAQPAGAATAKGRRWAILSHLAYLIPFHVPGLIVTILIWVWKRKQDALVDDQAREALNMQLNFFLLSVVLAATVIGVVLVPVVWVAGAVLCVIAAVRAADGERQRYPWIFRLIA